MKFSLNPSQYHAALSKLMAELRRQRKPFRQRQEQAVVDAAWRRAEPHQRVLRAVLNETDLSKFLP
jgi:hypothetical protein